MPDVIYFPEQRFRFMTEYDPSSLLQIDNGYGVLPIHWTIYAKPFEMVFDAMVRFYPKWKGLHTLFQKAKRACENHI